jgi:hypothetical protein
MGYSLAARFPSDISSQVGYQRVERELRRVGKDLSAYRFYDEPWWYVAVVGNSTDMKVFSSLARQMVRARGQIIPLPESTHDELLARRPPHPHPNHEVSDTL